TLRQPARSVNRRPVRYGHGSAADGPGRRAVRSVLEIDSGRDEVAADAVGGLEVPRAACGVALVDEAADLVLGEAGGGGALLAPARERRRRVLLQEAEDPAGLANRCGDCRGLALPSGVDE